MKQMFNLMVGKFSKTFNKFVRKNSFSSKVCFGFAEKQWKILLLFILLWLKIYFFNSFFANKSANWIFSMKEKGRQFSRGFIKKFPQQQWIFGALLLLKKICWSSLWRHSIFSMTRKIFAKFVRNFSEANQSIEIFSILWPINYFRLLIYEQTASEEISIINKLLIKQNTWNIYFLFSV